MRHTQGYIATASTILLTCYGQLVIKWQVGRAGHFPGGTSERVHYILRLLGSPWVLSAFGAAFIAALSWFVALSQFQLSSVYPFVSLTFVLVLFLSAAFFGESITVPKVAGLALVLAGLTVMVQ
jgi:drug/metabolite transporter (DMT)-like permease